MRIFLNMYHIGLQDMSRHTVGIVSAGVSCFLDIEQIRKSIGENAQHVMALDYTSFDQTGCKRFRALQNSFA